MHLAVCDDHIADRKQMERLLGRESDRRIPTTGVLYVDSYGSKNSVLLAPMIYDAMFLDMNEDDCDAVEIANMLRADGARIPIVFCCGKIDYRKSPDLPNNVFFLDKPIQVAELSQMIDILLEKKNEQVDKLEFRNRTETFYVTEQELVYAVPEGLRETKIHLLDGSDRITDMTFENFCGNLGAYDSYILLANRTVINMSYVKEISLFKVTLTNGTSFHLTLGEKGALSREVTKYRAKYPE
ncbi:MAG: hypothetical protein IJ390_04955 [Lachnospiraceae bacterium]|nr:hypothetical protein [Lachnospiraceae bacterium]